MRATPIIFILLFCIISTVSANIDAEGLNYGTFSSVNAKSGIVTITNTKANISVITSTKINDIEFKPVVNRIEKGELVWATGEKSAFLQDDPIVTFKYSYVGDSLKETIILKEDVKLSFPVRTPLGSRLIPWYDGQWKIVSTRTGSTMAGIICEKPYGKDAAGNNIEMGYVWDGNNESLVLDYKKFVKVYTPPPSKNITEEPKAFEEYSMVPISYPLIIDPTWTAVGDRWEATNGDWKVLMWNSTGSTTWAVPAGVYFVQFLVVGAGGGTTAGVAGVGLGGGGGGAEVAYNNTSALLPVSGTIDITVGAGASGANGGYSNFSSVGANGGGRSLGTSTWNGYNNSAGGITGSYGRGLKSSIYGYSYDGGLGLNYYARPGNAGGGGGGAAGAGYNNGQPGKANASFGGDGGAGVANNISGVLTYYGGGGGGGAYYSIDGATPGTGGIGGGGTGTVGAGANGGTNTGGGAGQGSGISGTTAAAGGSGIVMISYLQPTRNASFRIRFEDTSENFATTWRWNVTNLTGNNVEFTWSTEQNPVFNLSMGNWKINFTNNGAFDFYSRNIGFNLTTPRVYFWNRTS